MATKEEIEMLKNLSVDDIKKYRPDLFSNKSPKQIENTENMSEELIDNSKDNAGCLFLLMVFAIESIIPFVVILISPNLISLGGIYHYFILLGITLWIWSCLPNGKMTKKMQVIYFCIVPFLEFLIVQILSLSNWIGIGFAIIYPVIISLIYGIDLNDNNDSSGRSGLADAAILGAIHGLFGSARKR